MNEPWYYALPIAIGVFIGGSIIRSIFQVITGTTVQDEVDKAIEQASKAKAEGASKRIEKQNRR